MFLSLNLQYIHNLYYTVAPAEVRLVETRLVSFQLKNESLKKTDNFRPKSSKQWVVSKQ